MARHNESSDGKSSEVDSSTDRIQRRKIMKHMVEKRRRNRINGTLENMRVLVLKAQNKNPENYTKMEKADIMEMTTNFLYMLVQQKSLTGKISLPVTAPTQQFSNHYLSQHQHQNHPQQQNCFNNQVTQAQQYPPAMHLTTQQSDHHHHRSRLPSEYSHGYNTCQAEVNSYLHKYGIQKPLPTYSSPLVSPIASSTPVVKKPSATIPSSSYTRRLSSQEQHISSTTPIPQSSSSRYQHQMDSTSDEMSISINVDPFSLDESENVRIENIEADDNVCFVDNNNDESFMGKSNSVINDNHPVASSSNSTMSFSDSHMWRPW